MHAVVITKPGGPEVLQWTEVDDPLPSLEPGMWNIDLGDSGVC